MPGDRNHTADGEGWVAVSTHPNKERVALENLQRQAYRTYCPMLRRTVRHARRTRSELRPLFPGYVFAGLASTGQPWRPLLSTVGVRHVLCSGERPSPVPAGFIGALRAREIDGAVIRPSSPFAVGQDVRIVGGSFDGFVGTILSMNHRERIEVLLSSVQNYRFVARERDITEIGL